MTSMQHSLDWAEMPRGAVKTQGQHTRATVIVADNHPLELRGLSGLLAEDSQILLVSICQDGSAALVTAKELAPDIAIVDFNLPGLSGLEFLKAVHSEQLPTRVILLTADLSDSDMFDVMASQPFGLVLKSAAADTLLACIHEVAAGRPWFPDENIDAAVARETYRRRRGIELWDPLPRGSGTSQSWRCGTCPARKSPGFWRLPKGRRRSICIIFIRNFTWRTARR